MAWKRDPSIQSMIDWLDQGLPSKLKISLEDWDRLPSTDKFESCSPSDRQAIMEQARDCSDDFSYAARNYFWITTKKKQDQLFTLWESQYLILQKYYELKAMGKPQKLIVLKSRQLGCSTLIEAMIAWRAMFFPNTNAIVISVDQKHSSYLFGLMLHIYDKLPWWLKPMAARREEQYGMWFENPDEIQRSRHPGMNSKVFVQWSNQYSGVGQGIPIDAAHVSEFSNYFEEDLEAIVNEDLANSMADDPEVFGFMESTGKGAGTAAHLLWRACERRLDAGKWPKWYPLFIPEFFETMHVMAPPNGWTIPHRELVVRERIKKEWLRCNSPLCSHYRQRKDSMSGDSCPDCHVGELIPVVLSDEQLYWHQDRREQAEEQGTEAVKKWHQEQCITSEESWAVSGYVLFNDACREWMSETVEENPFKKGKIYRDNGEIHGANRTVPKSDKRYEHCYIPTCNVDHRQDETPFWVWEEPIKGAVYSIGVDVSEGIGQDYSVVFVNKVGGPHRPDEQVAVFRDNHTKPKDLAFYANVIGKWYNYGEMCVEYNTYQTAGDDLLYVYHYPNVYRWKHKDKINPMSQTWHWWTKPNTKAYLHQTAVDWLLSRCWIIRSKNFLEETTTYRKEEYASRSFGAASNCNDDELVSGCIALYCAHELDCDETGRIQIPMGIEESAPARYKMTCLKCKTVWGAANPEKEYRCPNEACQSIRITGEPTTSADPRKTNLDEACEWMSAQRDNEKPPEVELGVL